MTTIAYRDGVMASDSCWTYNKAQVISATKLHRLKSGAMLGMSGENDGRSLHKLLATAKTPADLPSFLALSELKQDLGALLVLKSGRIFHVFTGLQKDKDEECGVWEVNLPFAATGSGSDLALAAMACGKSAAEAVRIACRFDINSRLPVHTLKLVEAKK